VTSVFSVAIARAAARRKENRLSPGTVRAAILSLAALGLCASCERSRAPSATTEQPAAKAARPLSATAPNVELTTLGYDGILRLVESKRGKVVVMDAWSTSCAPCIAEFPKLVALHERYRPRGLACISLSFDYDGETVVRMEVIRERVLDFLEKQRATFDNVISSEESDDLYRKFHLASIPAVFVYDRQGKLRQRFDNVHAHSKAEMFNYEQVEKLVQKLLDEKSPAAE
jgi:thiol-disulfide isomerase/thioredoxin